MTVRLRRAICVGLLIGIFLGPASAQANNLFSLPPLLGIGDPGSDGVGAEGSSDASGTSASTSAGAFPVGWYDALSRRSSLSAIAGEGFSAVLPYSGDGSGAKAYLDQAAASGVRVYLEIPRDMVRRVDHAAVRTFVSTYEAHGALRGWYLADEPSINKDLGPLSPQNAKLLYETIKAEDALHPVAIAFAYGENAEAYRPAMDIMMYGDYPAYNGRPEFYRFGAWYGRTGSASGVASAEDGFYPVIQAYGESRSLLGMSATRRLPTKNEERYMAFSALELGADGLFFWARYRSDASWIDNVLVPLVATVTEMGPALARGGNRTAVTTIREDVHATTFSTADGATTYIVAIHHDGGSYEAPLKLSGHLASYTDALLLSDPPRRVPITDGTIRQTLGSFEVKVYKLGA